MNAEWRASFVTAVDLLHAAIDAIEHDPHDTAPERKHPQDAWCDASNALDIVAGERIAATDHARHPRRTAADALLGPWPQEAVETLGAKVGGSLGAMPDPYRKRRTAPILSDDEPLRHPCE